MKHAQIVFTFHENLKVRNIYLILNNLYSYLRHLDMYVYMSILFRIPSCQHNDFPYFQEHCTLETWHGLKYKNR